MRTLPLETESEPEPEPESAGRSAISILVPIGVAFVPLLVGACYWWTWANGDLIRGYSWFYVSDLGNTTPQQYLFAFGFSAVAVLFSVVTVVRFLQWRVALASADVPCGHRALNVILLIAAMIGLVSLVLLASLSDLTYHTEHDVFSGICFGALTVYEWCHTGLCFWSYTQRRQRIRARRYGGDEEPLVIDERHFFVPSNFAMLLVYLLINCICFASLLVLLSKYLAFDAGQPPIAENMLIFFSVAYFLPFVVELQNATCGNIHRHCHDPCCGDFSSSSSSINDTDTDNED